MFVSQQYLFLKVIHCVSLEVETVFINIILTACFNWTAIYDFYIHITQEYLKVEILRTQLRDKTLACCKNRACVVSFMVMSRHTLLKKTSQV